MLRTILVADGYRIIAEASNGKAGVEQAIKLKPDLVFLDIEMPDTSGVDVLKELMKELPKTIVLMVSGLRDAETIKSCLASGAAGFIIKPFNAGTVLKVMRDAVIRAEQRTPPTRIS
ncbi:response regulator [Actimicrobium sp. GrIS 1.19]|uniref:response regulator n=1 Tax=Actimicrobium sp. GrIS 1.19 TaxID=3071708 RepID=UPI003FA3D4FA